MRWKLKMIETGSQKSWSREGLVLFKRLKVRLGENQKCQIRSKIFMGAGAIEKKKRAFMKIGWIMASCRMAELRHSGVKGPLVREKGYQEKNL